MSEPIVSEDLQSTYYKGHDTLKNSRLQDAIKYAKRHYLIPIPASQTGFTERETPEGMVVLYAAHQLMALDHFTYADTAFLLLQDVQTLIAAGPEFARQLDLTKLLIDMGPSRTEPKSHQYSLENGYYRRLVYKLMSGLQVLSMWGEHQDDPIWKAEVLTPKVDPALHDYLVEIEQHVRERRIVIRNGLR